MFTTLLLHSFRDSLRGICSPLLEQAVQHYRGGIHAVVAYLAILPVETVRLCGRYHVDL